MTDQELRELIEEVDKLEVIGVRQADLKWMSRARDLAETVLRYRGHT